METNQKRSSAEIRAETKTEGAVFIHFNKPAQTPTHWWNQWTKMQKYGFFVLTTACILPYRYYRKTFKKGDKLKGHQRAIHCFHNREPDRSNRVNQHGWPCDEQISHLCHNPDCCNPIHLVIEPRWKNMRRNFCGENGVCDCGMQPPCIRTYTNPETFAESWTLETDVQRVRDLLAALNAKYPFVIQPKTFYDVDDQKSNNRKKRKKRGKKHEEQRSNKVAKIVQ